MLFHINPRIEALPRPWRLNHQITRDPGYRFTGRGRTEFSYSVFQYTLAGCGRFHYGDKHWDLPPGTGFLCNIQDPHYVYALSPHREWEFFYIQMLGPSTQEMTAAINDRFGQVFQLPMHRGIIKRLRDWLDTRFEGILSAAAGKQVIDQLLDAILEVASTDAQEDSIMHLALKTIQEDPGRPLDATILARTLGISREHLTRLFAQQLGQSPYAYIVEHRVHQAAWELRHSKRSVADIAAGNGFSSPELLCKCFKRILGCTPSQWRKLQGP